MNKTVRGLKLFLVAAAQDDRESVEGVGVEPVLFDRVEDVKVDAEQALALEDRVLVEMPFAQRNPHLGKHTPVLGS